MGQLNSIIDMNAEKVEITNLFMNVMAGIFSKETNTLISKEIKDLTHQRFYGIIAELNTISRTSLDVNGNHMMFAVRKGSDKGILWKAVVEIACVKIDRDYTNPKSYRLLTLGELLQVYFTLKSQLAAINQSIETSVNQDEFMNNVIDKENLVYQCSICFERKHELTLPCTHSFCSQCLEEWNSENPTCPICRAKLDSTDDTWVLSERPSPEDVRRELRLNLLELSEERETSCVTS